MRPLQTNTTIVFPGGTADDDLGRKTMISKFCPGKACAEIGVFDGTFSQAILDQKPVSLLLIDCWKGQPNHRYLDPCNRRDDAFEVMYKTVLGKFAGRPEVKIVRAFSYQASASTPDDSLDFCYLDARHSALSTLADCVTWWRKVKVGGVLAGHDYDGPFGDAVRIALDEFIYTIHYDRLDYLTSEVDHDGNPRGYNSWGIRKFDDKAL